MKFEFFPLLASTFITTLVHAHTVEYQLFTVKGATLTIARDFAPGNRVIGYELTKASQFKGFSLSRATGRTSRFSVAGAVSTFPLAASGTNVLGQLTLDFSSTGTHGFIQARDGTVTLIDVPAGSHAAANGMNSAGTVVGSFVPSSGAAEEAGFVLADGVYTPYEIPGTLDTELQGVTDTGVLIGSYRLSQTGAEGTPFVGFVDDHGMRTDISVPGAFDTLVQGVNADGWLCGYYDLAGVQGFTGFIYDGVSFTQIAPPGATSTYVWHISDDGRVVGYSYFADGSESSFIATIAN